MPPAPTDWLARYQPWRRQAEIGFWVVVLGLQVVFNSLVSWIDLRRVGAGLPYWQPLAWELTSTVVVGALIPAVVAWERRFPVRWDTWRQALPWHLAGSLLFCGVHVVGMVVLRQGLYALLQVPYPPPDWLRILGYEFLKDVRTYFMLLVAVWSYRLLLLRAQGEARVLDAPEPPAGRAAEAEEEDAADASPAAFAPAGAAAAPPSGPAVIARPERFLVRKLRKEFLIAAADIEWIQAQGNYLALHVNGHDYLLRSTLQAFLGQLDPARFAQVHRSYAVNLDRVAVIEPLEAGDARLTMKDGSQVPCSRRYRDALGGGGVVER